MRTLLLSSVLSVWLFAGCTKLPEAPPPTSAATIIINGLESPGQRDFPCWKTAGGPNYIDFQGTVVIKYASRNRYATLQEVAFSSPTTVNKFPVSVSVQIPNDNSPYKIEIYVRGKDCSRCASRWTAPNEPYTPCIPRMVATGYEIAYPRWASISSSNTYQSTYTINSIFPDFNVPYTCYTCTVPF